MQLHDITFAVVALRRCTYFLFMELYPVGNVSSGAAEAAPFKEVAYHAGDRRFRIRATTCCGASRCSIRGSMATSRWWTSARSSLVCRPCGWRKISTKNTPTTRTSNKTKRRVCTQELERHAQQAVRECLIASGRVILCNWLLQVKINYYY